MVAAANPGFRPDEDPTVYPTEERVGEDILQRWIMELLRPLVERWVRHRGERAFVGADQFIYYEQYNAHKRVAPDVYVLPGVAPDTMVTSWKTWQQGVVPSFAFEVVSRDWEKDYVEAPRAHGEVGTQELIVFDPSFESRSRGARWQRFGRKGESLVLEERTDADRIESPALGCFLRAVGSGQKLRVRIGAGPSGEDLFPTAEEAALAEAAELRQRLAELEGGKRR